MRKYYFYCCLFIFSAISKSIFAQTPAINDDFWYTKDSRREPSLWSTVRGSQNVQYQKVIARLKSYPVSTSPKGCLAVESSKEKLYKVKTSWYRHEVQVGGNQYYRDPLKDGLEYSLEETGETAKYYKNTCNREIVVKGMMRKWDYTSYSGPRYYSYFNISYVIPPGEKVDYFKFTKGGWNDQSDYDAQYFIDEDVKVMK